MSWSRRIMAPDAMCFDFVPLPCFLLRRKVLCVVFMAIVLDHSLLLRLG